MRADQSAPTVWPDDCVNVHNRPCARSIGTYIHWSKCIIALLTISQANELPPPHNLESKRDYNLVGIAL